MSTNKTLAKKLSLSTETVRVLTADELNSIAGGAGDSNQSICIGNGKTNQANSVLGYCPTVRPQPQTVPEVVVARLKLRLAVETVRILDLEAVTGGFLLAGNRRLGDAVNNYSKGGSCQGLCMSNGQGKDCASMLGNCEGG